MRLKFAPFAYDRKDGLPHTRLINLYPEPDPVSGGVRLLQRHGLKEAYSLGAQGIRGLYQQDGVFDGDLFAVAGTTLYRGTEAIGAVALGSVAKFAASDTQLVVVVGGVAYCYDGDTLEAIDMPDDQTVVDVALAGDRFYFPVVEDVGRVYFSDLADATTVQSLNFFTIDAQPDGVVGVTAVNEQVIFFGRTTTEFWQPTGDADAPLIRSQGTTQSKGTVSARSIVAADNRRWFIGDDLKIYTAGTPHQRVSNHALEEALRQCDTPGQIVGFAVTFDGNDLVCWNVPGQGTYAYHIETQTWAQWTTHGDVMFRCDTACLVEGVAYLGDRITGTVYTLDHERMDADEPIEFVATCIAPPGIIAVLELDCAVGVGLQDNSDALVEMRYSTDRGRTWTAWRPTSLGLVGQYEARPRWRRLGLSRHERIIEFRVTSPVMVSLAGVNVQ
jgi:hypothetical protein